MRLISTCVIIAVSSTALAGFSMEDYKKAKAAKGETVTIAKKVAAIEVDYKLAVKNNSIAIEDNQSSIDSIESKIVVMTANHDLLNRRLNRCNFRLQKIKSIESARKGKGVISTGNSRVRIALSTVAKAKDDVRKSYKSIKLANYAIRKHKKRISSARIKLAYYKRKVYQESLESGACV